MEFFRYWAHAELKAKDAKGKVLKLRKWSGSNTSTEDAMEAAQRAVSDLARRVSGMVIKNKTEDYAYGTGAIPEELIGEPGPTHAMTRNRYGCQILNATHAMFVDVDVAQRGVISKLLFGDKEKKQRDVLQAWLAKHSGAGIRIYRTAAGFRYLFTHRALTVNADTLQWQRELNADRLYIQLCKVQQCYRARLTPKPWRIKMVRPPNHFPYHEPEAQATFETWLRYYERNSNAYATCRLLETLGAKTVHPDLLDIVREHDEISRAKRDLPLA